MRRTIGLLLAMLSGLPAYGAEPTKEELVKLLATIDDRQRNNGDFKTLVYLEQKEKDKADIVREVLVYRRDADDKLMLLFSKPKSEEGKGYLRLDKN